MADLHEATGNRVGADWLRSRAGAWESMAEWIDEAVDDERLNRIAVMAGLYADGKGEPTAAVYAVGRAHVQLVLSAGIQNARVVIGGDPDIYLSTGSGADTMTVSGSIDAIIDACRQLSDDLRPSARWGTSAGQITRILTVLSHPFEVATGYEGEKSAMHGIRLLAEGARLLVETSTDSPQARIA